ncbi:acyltransferase family protein [Dermacoccaceae bacterium W4C1]
MSADAGRTPAATPATPAQTPPAKRGMRKDIQALRALSVLLVVGYHLWPGRITGGFIGVDIFFVISGFLITDHLLRDAGKKGRISLTQFWTRRAFRLLPASLLVIVLTGIATVIWVGEEQWRTYFKQALGSGFYVQNWVLSSSATDYLGSSEPPTAFQHFWSLSVEEQFYIFLPLILVLTLWATRGRANWRNLFFVVVATITGASLLWSIYLTATNAAAAYFVTTTRAWEFGLGSLLAFAGAARLQKVPPVFGWIGVGAIVLAGFTYTGTSPAFPGYAALLPTLGAVLALATARHDRVFDAVANWRPIQIVGDASYSIYLWHWPIVVIAPYALGHELGFVGRTVILVVSLALGYASMRWVETPLRAHGFARWRTPSGAAVASGMVGVLVVGLGGFALVGQREASAREQLNEALSGANPCVGAPALGRSDCPAPTALTPSPALMAKDDGNRGACWSSQGVAEVKRCTLGKESGTSVHAYAVGDSHNNALIPAYEKAAQRLGWQIDVSGKAGCYATSYDVPVVDRDVAACRTWRKNVVDDIVKDDKVGVVIVTRNEAGDEDLSASERTDTVNGLRSTWKRFTDAGKHVIVIQDVPTVEQKTIDCVSQEGLAAATRCEIPQKTAYPEFSAMRTAAQGMDNVSYVSTEDEFCLDDSCPPVIGGVPVFANPGHVTKTFSSTLGPELGLKLQAARG